VKVVASIVEGSMSSEKVAETVVLIGILIALLLGSVEFTVGAV
jgi:hypothetical protein